MTKLYPDEPDTEVTEVTDVDAQSHTLIGGALRGRRPAPPGTRYCMKYPPQIDMPVDVVIVAVPGAVDGYE